jgi:hypothetical protein
MLIEAGANVKTGNPILLAASNGTTTTVKLLIEAGADVNTMNTRNKTTCIHLAARRGCEETVKVLIAAGANVNGTSTGGYTPTTTPIAEALIGGHTDIVKILIDAGAETSSLPDIELLDNQSNEYIKICKMMYSDHRFKDKKVIRNIHKVCNTTLRETFDTAVSNRSGRCLMYHCSATPGSVSSILNHGLKLSYADKRGLHGPDRLYFSQRPSTSLCYDANCCIFIFGVFLPDNQTAKDNWSYSSPDEIYSITRSEHCVPLYIVNYKNAKNNKRVSMDMLDDITL